MKIDLAELGKREYPGRFLMIGMYDHEIYAIYGVTARSASSRAKRYIYQEEKRTVEVVATDAEVMAEGNLDLLQYNAAYFLDHAVVIGNGRQTDLVTSIKKSASETLSHALKNESYEPDKYNTPRITGCVQKSVSGWDAALHIIRAGNNGETCQDVFHCRLENQKGYFISTYAGPNVRPTTSFDGDPIEFEFPAGAIEEISETIYQTFKPQDNQEDLRVSLVTTKIDMAENKSVFIINSIDR